MNRIPVILGFTAFAVTAALAAPPPVPGSIGITMIESSSGVVEMEDHVAKVQAMLLGDSSVSGLQVRSVQESSVWLTGGGLHAGNDAREPELELSHVQNHSWVGQAAVGVPLAISVDAVRRLDHWIARDGFTAVVSLDNGADTETPELLAHAYNVITVGRVDGGHSRGGTWFEGVGRTKPDLVGVMPATSLNVPAVSAAAAWLLRVAQQAPALAEAARPEAVKALLMSSASREAIAGWHRTPQQPLDPVMGAGVLDAAQAMRVLRVGSQPRKGEESIAPLGWRSAELAPGGDELVLQVPQRTRLEQVTVTLAWNRSVLDEDPTVGFLPQVSLANLDLAIYREEPDGRMNLVQASRSAVNNVEHLALDELQPGRYRVQISGDEGQRYAIAWSSRPIASAGAGP